LHLACVISVPMVQLVLKLPRSLDRVLRHLESKQ
jgi:hypothetical protein